MGRLSMLIITDRVSPVANENNNTCGALNFNPKIQSNVHDGALCQDPSSSNHCPNHAQRYWSPPAQPDS